jgi:hypothetical protein
VRLEEMLEPEERDEGWLGQFMKKEPVTFDVDRRFIEALDRYVKDRIPTGGFLGAVLCNNLKEAVGMADIESQLQLCAIVSYCYNHIPSESWGSPEKVAQWLTKS